MRRKAGAALFLGFVLACAGCGSRHEAVAGEDPVVRPAITGRLPHDVNAFTQGLLMDGEVWLESTGQYGKSDLREVDVRTGEVLRKVPLDRRHFGEGLALWKNRLYQLTWRERVCIVYDRETFKEIERFRYSGEGWGLTNNERHLFMSDGSATIRVKDPNTFRELRRFEVRGAQGPVTRLNELEWIDGEIWANIFQTKFIVRFDPSNGRVLGFIDLRHLPPEEDRHPGEDVLNGIAVDPANGDIWVTGKYWKALYRLDWPPGE